MEESLITYILYVRITGYFLPDGGSGSVAGINPGFGRQSEKLGTDTVHQSLPVAAHTGAEVGTSDAAEEKDIARKQHFLVRKIIAQTMEAVTRKIEHLNFGRTE